MKEVEPHSDAVMENILDSILKKYYGMYIKTTANAPVFSTGCRDKTSKTSRRVCQCGVCMSINQHQSMIRQLLYYYSVLCLLFLVFTSPVKAQTGLDQAPNGGTVTIGKVAVGSLMFHPLFNSLSVEREIADLIYGEGLLHVDRNGDLENGLAYLPVKLEEGREWIFRIRQGITFHDGEPLTAEDVVFTYNLYKESRSYDPVFHRYFQNLESIQSVTRRTIRFVMKTPIETFPAGLAALPILPKHQLDRRPIAAANPMFDVTRPVGLGPFRIETWPVHDTVILSANEKWHHGRPHLDGVIYKFYPSTEALQSAFVTRKVDMVEVDRRSNLKELKRARGDVKIQAIQPANRAFSAVFYNHAHPILSDVVIRRALTYATDRTRILNKVVVPGAGEIAHSPIEPTFWAQGGAEHFKYDPGKAIDLLRKQGWRDSDHDGILDRDRQPLRFELLFPRGSLSSEKIVRLIKLNLNDIGIKVIPTPVDQKELVERLRVGSYAAALFIQDFDPTPDDFYAVFHSESIGLGNVLGYSNRQIDRNINFLFGLSEQSRALPIYQQLQQLISQDQPCMFLYFIQTQYVAYNPDFKNIGAPGEALLSPAAWYHLLSDTP